MSKSKRTKRAQLGLGDPGKGFYEYARELGVYTGSDDLGFWAKEVKWLHDYWSSH